MFMLRNERVGSALGAFADRIHCWYPVLSFEFPTNFSSFLSGHVSSPVDTCLALLALAIGSLAEKGNIAEALHERLDAPYYDEAAGMLQDILCDYTLGGLQCLILFSIYFMCCLKPCQAHDYILMASFKAQNMLKSRTFSDDNSRSESLQRAYWAVLLIESMDHLSPQDSSDLTRSYFMAEIAMRRMLQRCTTSVSKSAGGHLRYAPLIAAELELQLNEWYDYLPPLLRFQKTPSKGSELAILPTTLFLQTQYSACKISIFWPAIYQAIETGTANDELLHYCEKFLDEYMSFVLAASASLKSCLPNAWTLAASLFIISMAAIRALSVDCIRELRHEQLYHCIHAALEAVGEVAPFSPSLMALHGILRNAVDSINSSPG
uniref:Transcription factor domain-containing protein n=1 Tax=Bionectria ochroleuca TaxID=29856 RepID=A0A0B7K4S7_BIOOC